MSIQGPNNSPIRHASETPLSSAVIRGESKPAGSAERVSDQVEISEAARRLAGGFAPAGGNRAEIASRIASGAYNGPEAVEALAKRLLSSGDL